MKNIICSNYYNIFLFDLDDTLYPEKKYLEVAYKSIGEFCEQQNWTKSSVGVTKFLVTTFEEEGRSKIFDKLIIWLKMDGEDKKKFAIKSFLHLLHSAKPPQLINLYPYAHHLITTLLSENKTIIVLTNGNQLQQRNKVKNINWRGVDEKMHFVFANDFAPKPNRKVYDDYLNHTFNLSFTSSLFIGDSVVDEEFSKNVGIDFVYINQIIVKS